MLDGERAASSSSEGKCPFHRSSCVQPKLWQSSMYWKTSCLPSSNKRWKLYEQILSSMGYSKAMRYEFIRTMRMPNFKDKEANATLREARVSNARQSFDSRALGFFAPDGRS